MKTANPAHRIFALAKSNAILIAAGCFGGALFSAISSLSSPALYHSTASLKIEAQAAPMMGGMQSNFFDPFAESAAALTEARAIFKSQDVLTPVASYLIDNRK